MLGRWRWQSGSGCRATYATSRLRTLSITCSPMPPSLRWQMQRSAPSAATHSRSALVSSLNFITWTIPDWTIEESSRLSDGQKAGFEGKMLIRPPSEVLGLELHHFYVELYSVSTWVCGSGRIIGTPCWMSGPMNHFSVLPPGWQVSSLRPCLPLGVPEGTAAAEWQPQRQLPHLPCPPRTQVQDSARPCSRPFW